MQADGLALLRPAQLLCEKVDGVDIARDDLEQPLAFDREFDAAMFAPDEGYTQLILQPADLIADRRLRQPQG